MDTDNLVATEEQECTALLGLFEDGALAGLTRVPIPAPWVTTARYFMVAALLRLASKLMIAALTDDPDTRHHARYADMVGEVLRRIAPWSGAPVAMERIH